MVYAYCHGISLALLHNLGNDADLIAADRPIRTHRPKDVDFLRTLYIRVP